MKTSEEKLHAYGMQYAALRAAIFEARCHIEMMLSRRASGEAVERMRKEVDEADLWQAFNDAFDNGHISAVSEVMRKLKHVDRLIGFESKDLKNGKLQNDRKRVRDNSRAGSGAAIVG